MRFLRILYTVFSTSVVLVLLHACNASDNRENGVQDEALDTITNSSRNKGGTVIGRLYEDYSKDTSSIQNLVDLCRYYTVHGDFDSSLYFAASLEGIYRRSGSVRAELYSNLYKGQSYLLSCGHDSTGAYLERAMFLADSTNNTDAMCNANNALGIYSASIEMDFHKAIDYFLKAIRLSEGKYPVFNLTARCNLANLYYMRNDPAGLKYAESVYLDAKESGNDYLSFGGGVLSAYMRHLAGDNAKALEYIEESLPYTEKYGYKTELYSLYAMILHAREEYDKAEKYYKLSLKYLDEKQITPAIISYLNYGAFLTDMSRPEEALTLLEKGIELSLRSNYTVHRDLLYLKKSEAEEMLHDYKSALADYKDYHEVADSIYNTEREYSINELRIKYEAESNENRLKEQALVLMRQSHRLQIVTLGLVLAIIVILLSYFFYRRKEKMYKQIVKQHHDYLNGQKCLSEQDSSLDDRENERNLELFKRIDHLLIKEKLFCSSDISTDKLAKLLNTNRTYISKAINCCSGKNFNSYLNGYRIKEAISRLSDVNDDIPLKALAQELGYNSIQTFYSSFQNEIGMPPSKFREKSIEMYRKD